MGQLGPNGMRGDRGLSVRSFFLCVLSLYAGNKYLTVFVACVTNIDLIYMYSAGLKFTIMVISLRIYQLWTLQLVLA